MCAQNEIECLLKVLPYNTERHGRMIFETMHLIRTIDRDRSSVLRKWILDILLWFYTNAERRRQRWAYSEITFVPGGCSSFGLLLALQHRSSSFPSLNHLIRFYFLVDRPFFQINSFFLTNPLISQSSSVGVPLKARLIGKYHISPSLSLYIILHKSFINMVYTPLNPPSPIWPSFIVLLT